MNTITNYGASSLLSQFDMNGDGLITVEDFIIAARSLGLGESGDAVIRNIFMQIDRNQNGILEPAEAFEAYQLIQNLVQGGGLTALLNHRGGNGVPYNSEYDQGYGYGQGSPYNSGFGYGYGSRY